MRKETVSEFHSVLVAGAEPERVNFCMKDGGTFILKFRRQEVNGTEISDSDQLTVSDTHRVIHAEKPAKDGSAAPGNFLAAKENGKSPNSAFGPGKNIEKKDKS